MPQSRKEVSGLDSAELPLLPAVRLVLLEALQNQGLLPNNPQHSKMRAMPVLSF